VAVCGSSNSSFLHMVDQSCRQDPRGCLVAALYSDGNTLVSPPATLVPTQAEPSLTFFKGCTLQAAQRASFALKCYLFLLSVSSWSDYSRPQDNSACRKAFKICFFSVFSSRPGQTFLLLQVQQPVTADPLFVTVSVINISRHSGQERFPVAGDVAHARTWLLPDE